jgi:hypothetical protein
MPLSNTGRPRIVAGALIGALLATGAAAGASTPAFAAACITTPLPVNISVFLSGYSFGGADEINASYDPADPQSRPFPTTEPYSTDGHSLLRGGAGNTVTNLTPVADWVIVELRDTVDASLIVATDTVPVDRLTGAALTTPEFAVPAGSYRVAIAQRNHLTAMAATPVTLGAALTPTVDFTDPATLMYNQVPANAGKERYPTPARLQLVPGDFDANGVIDAADYTALNIAVSQQPPGYSVYDINLDGFVDGSDTGTFNAVVAGQYGAASVPAGRLAPVPVCDAPRITSAAPSNPTSGTPYTSTVTASGTGPITYAVSNGTLPPGLTLDPTTGTISGTATTPGSYLFRVTATNAYGADSADYTLAIAAPPVITTPTIPAGTAGTPYSQTITTTGSGPITYTVTNGALPPGLALDATTGVISGTPSQSGAFSFSITASNAAGADTRTYGVTIGATVSPPTSTPRPVVPASSNSSHLAVTGGDYTASLSAGVVGLLMLLVGASAYVITRRRRV